MESNLRQSMGGLQGEDEVAQSPAEKEPEEVKQVLGLLDKDNIPAVTEETWEPKLWRTQVVGNSDHTNPTRF